MFNNIDYGFDKDFDDVNIAAWVSSDKIAWPVITNDWLTSHKEKLLPLCDNRRVAVQAGGNCGLYPKLLSKYFERVYTVEPDPVNFHCLAINCDRPNIIKMNAAVGETNELVSIKVQWSENVGMHQVEHGVGSSIPTILIDQLALDQCDLLWLDTEGYEIHALRGALKTIKEFSPIISLEDITQECLDLLEPIGYYVAAVSEMDTILIRK